MFIEGKYSESDWRRLRASPVTTYHLTVFVPGSGRVWQAYLQQTAPNKWQCSLAREGWHKDCGTFDGDSFESVSDLALTNIRKVFQVE